MRPTSVSRSVSRSPFLEPPHSHDPTVVECVVSLPSLMMSQLPSKVQGSVVDLQESASVLYASYERLLDLLDQRFERLMPSVGPDGPTFSESSFFNYRNQVQAEKTYLLSDVVPDWRHKASTANAALQPYQTMTAASLDEDHPKSVNEWWAALHAEVSSWLDDAKRVTIPTFEETAEDYLAGTCASAASDNEESTPLETPEGEESLLFPPTGLSHLVNEAKHDSTSDGIRKGLEGRKDSGIYLDD